MNERSIVGVVAARFDAVAHHGSQRKEMLQFVDLKREFVLPDLRDISGFPPMAALNSLLYAHTRRKTGGPYEAVRGGRASFINSLGMQQ
jgi:hypothetical protein